jgi:hypothetical protein
MNTLLILLSLAVFVGLSIAVANGPGLRDSWTPLFDGKSLDGWEHVGPGGFTIEDGTLQTQGGMGLLWYTGHKLGNCEIKVVYKTQARQSNSGVFIRIADRPRDPWFAVHHGYEIQLCDVGDDYHTTGCIYSLTKAKARPSLEPGEWNTMLITLDGPRVKIVLNDVEVTDFDSQTSEVPARTKDHEPERGPRPEVGYFGVQNHDDAAGNNHVWFREIGYRSL